MKDDVKLELLRAGLDDWVSLDEAAWVIAGGEFSQATRMQVQDGLAELFRASLMVPGDLGNSGFVDWYGGAADWTARSRQVLGETKWPPMGAGFWLRLTALGRARLDQQSADR